MPLRPPAGFISAFYDPLKNPNAPTIGTATGGDTSASVAFTAPSNVGGSAITGYGARSTPGDVTATASASPISVTGLTNGTAYTFAVWAINTYGPSAFSGASNSVTPAVLNRGFWIGGSSNVIQYIEIATTGNSSDFGDLITSMNYGSACGSTTRIVTAIDAVIEYFAAATLGNASSFGSLGFSISDGAACNSATRGVFGGGSGSPFSTAAMAYVTIASTGNSTTFGNLSQSRSDLAACSSSTRGIFGGGIISSGGFFRVNTIDYITIASTGNATDFGDLTVARGGLASCSSSTRGIFAGGDAPSSYSNVIDYITIGSTGNATDFGDLTLARYDVSGCSNATLGVFGGGAASSGNSNIIDYITIASTSNATDFGDLTVDSGQGITSASNSNGGTQ